MMETWRPYDFIFAIGSKNLTEWQNLHTLTSLCKFIDSFFFHQAFIALLKTRKITFNLKSFWSNYFTFKRLLVQFKVHFESIKGFKVMSGGINIIPDWFSSLLFKVTTFHLKPHLHVNLSHSIIFVKESPCLLQTIDKQTTLQSIKITQKRM